MSNRVVHVGMLFAACGGGDAAPDAAAVDAVACPAGTVATTTTSRGFGTSINGALDGTVVCVHGRSDIPCKQSIGSFASICMPTGVDVAILASKFGWQSSLGLYPPDSPSLFTELADDAFSKLAWEAAGGTYPAPADAYIVVSVCDATTCPDAGAQNPFTGIANAQVALGPAIAPVYADQNQFPDPTLTMTSTSGIAYFKNVPPGMYDVTATAAGYTTCRKHDRASGRSGGWMSPTAGAHARVPAIAGANTEVLLRCSP